MENKHYVYAVFVEKKLKYIGKGKDARFTHGCNGISHVFGLNEEFFQGKLMEVGIVKNKLTDEESLSLEKDLIDAFGKASDVCLYNVRDNNLTHETYPNMTQTEFYDHCTIVRTNRYVKGEYQNSRPGVYNIEGIHPHYPL